MAADFQLADTDGEGTPLTTYSEVMESFADEMLLAMSKKMDEATWNYLMAYGIPQEPRDIALLVQTMFKSGITWAVVKGYATLTEQGVSPEDELASKRRKKPPRRHPASDIIPGTYL